MTPLSFILLGFLSLVMGLCLALLLAFGEASGSFISGLTRSSSPKKENTILGHVTAYGLVLAGVLLIIYGSLKAGLAGFFISILEFFA